MFKILQQFCIFFPKEEKSNEDIQREQEKKDIKLIKKYKIPYVIVDRQTGRLNLNVPLSRYNRKYHDLRVDAHQYMKYIMSNA